MNNLPPAETTRPAAKAGNLETDVLIVGAGPTGLALAATLLEAGVRPIIVDKLAAGLNTSRAAVIHAHTLEILQELGVAERLLREGIKVSRFTIRDRNQVLLQLRFDQLPTPMPHLLMLPQDVTERLLTEKVEELGGRVCRGWTVDRVTETHDSVLVEIATPDGPRRIRARYVVGADGMHSLVRASTGVGFTGGNYEESFVLADVELVGSLPRDEVMLFFSPAGLVVVAPLPGNTFRIVATVEQAPRNPDAGEIQSLLQSRGSSRDTVTIKRVVWSSRFRLQHRLADHYREGRRFLIGDAAHVHSPAGGQGMNTGLVDAWVLGRILTEVLTGRRSVALLDQYETLRRPAAQKVLRLAGGLTEMATMRSGPRRFLRNLRLKMANRLPLARRRFAMNLSGLSRRKAAVIHGI